MTSCACLCFKPHKCAAVLGWPFSATGNNELTMNSETTTTGCARRMPAESSTHLQHPSPETSCQAASTCGTCNGGHRRHEGDAHAAHTRWRASHLHTTSCHMSLGYIRPAHIPPVPAHATLTLFSTPTARQQHTNSTHTRTRAHTKNRHVW
jgi:hypothetical protein